MAAANAIAPDLPPSQDAHLQPASGDDISPELKARARQFIQQEKFNRRFTLPATDAHGELTITYAVGGMDCDTAPTVLFIGGMLGGRFLASMAEHVGRTLGMRVVFTDRPGMGGSTQVPVHLRLQVWLETIPVLMRTLNARHLSLAAHSCGVIYAFNTIYHMPHILPPHNRKLYLFSPWVSPDHSGVTLLSTASYLPSPLINKFDSVVRFVNSTVMPSIQFSSMLPKAVSKSFGGNQERSESDKPLPRHEREDVCQEYCGVSAAESVQRSKEVMRACFAEDTKGANHEALLSLKKGVAGGWGVCDDYGTFPDMLDAKMREFFASTGGDGQFVVKTLWAEEDMMIGKKGEKYFDGCFERFSRSSGDAAGERPARKCLVYGSEVVPETNHETVALPQYEAMSRVLRDMLDGRSAV